MSRILRSCLLTVAAAVVLVAALLTRGELAVADPGIAISRSHGSGPGCSLLQDPNDDTRYVVMGGPVVYTGVLGSTPPDPNRLLTADTLPRIVQHCFVQASATYPANDALNAHARAIEDVHMPTLPGGIQLEETLASAALRSEFRSLQSPLHVCELHTFITPWGETDSFGPDPDPDTEAHECLPAIKSPIR